MLVVSVLLRIQPEKRSEFLSAMESLLPRVQWLRRQGGHRILVFVHQGTLCVNHTYGKGFSMEPGTLDHDMMMI